MSFTRSLGSSLLIAIALTLLFWGPLWLGYGFVGGDLYPYFFPQKAFFSDRLHAGEFPLWNNLTGFGYPVLGESQTGAAYPPHVVAYYLLDVNTAYNVEHLLHYVLCFVATWLFARRVGLGGSGSILMALVFTYGWFPPRACLEWAVVTGAWLPVALWCVESFVQTRGWRYAIGLSFVLGLQLLAGHFHLAFITQLLVVAYGGWRVWGSGGETAVLVPTPPSSGERVRVRGSGGDHAIHTKPTASSDRQPSTILHPLLAESPSHPSPLPPKAGGEGTRQEKTGEKTEEPLTLTLSPQSRGEGTGRGRLALVAPVALAIAAGFLLASVQLLPAWELKARSSRATVGGEHDPAYGHLPPLYVSQMIAPFLWYSPIAIGDESVIRDVAEFGAPWHWFGPHHDLEGAVQQARFGAIGAATNKVEAHLYCGLIPLGLAVWWLVMGRKPRLKVEGRGLKGRAGHGSTLTLNPQPSTFNPAFWLIAGLIALIYATGWLLPVARHVPGFNFFRGPGRYGIVTSLAVALLAGRGLDALVARRGLLGRRVVIGLVFWSTCGDLWLVSRMVTNVVMVPHPAISFREQSHVRRLLLDEPTLPRLYCPGQNVGNLLGVSCLPVYLGIAPREYADPKFAGTGMPKPPDDGRPVMANDEFSRWLRESGVTHVLSFHPLDDSSWRATLVWSGFDEMLNRAWGRREPIYLYRMEADESGLPPSRVGFAARDTDAPGTAARATVPAQREANRIIIETESPGGASVVLKELGFPGWRVRNDEQPVDADVDGFRSVRVPDGVRRVTWTYRPRSVRVGVAVSLLTLFVLAALGHLRFWHCAWLERCLARVHRRQAASSRQAH